MESIIEELKKIDLTKYPTEQISSLLNGIGKVAFMLTDYDKGKTFDRAVPNNESEPVFNSVSRISYKPEKFNTTYQRASTPNNTMFYAAVVPEDVSEDEIKNARITGASETCDLLRCADIKNGERTITFGKWGVKERISLVTILDTTKKYKIKFLNDQVDTYLKNLGSETPDMRNKTIDYLKYLSYEFSKPIDCHKDCDYMISAIFTEIITKMNNVDGILYPSVRTGLDGICVAIHPKAINKIELIKVLQSRIVKKEGDALITNLKYCNVNPPNSNFEMRDI